jgi:ATP-dependent DNA helicase RecG
VTDIADITGEGKYTIKGSVQSLTSIRIRGGRTLQKATLTDDTDSIPATWFNQNYLSKALRPNEVYLFQGNVKQRGAHLEIFPNNFEQIIEGREQLHLGRLSPQYALTSGIILSG